MSWDLDEVEVTVHLEIKAECGIVLFTLSEECLPLSLTEIAI